MQHRSVIFLRTRTSNLPTKKSRAYHLLISRFLANKKRSSIIKKIKEKKGFSLYTDVNGSPFFHAMVMF